MTAADVPFALTKIGQIALSVRDMDRAVRFYRDSLGMRFLFQAPNVAFFDCDGIRLMLGQNEKPEQTPSGTILYYRVQAIHEAFDTLRQRGVDVVRPPHLVAKLPAHDLWMAFLRDPDENIFGLMCEVPR
jgi:methylmalonyl-CoA/ethylmalonyl-CoA epimerase